MNARVALCFIAKSLAAMSLAALWLGAPAFAQNPRVHLKGQLRLPEFAALTAKASETVNVTLDASLLGMGCRFLNSTDPEQAAAKKLCTSLNGIYVRHFTFETDDA